jgi:sugar (pentulose or hexulose) kinase
VLVYAVDVGTTNVKVVLYDDRLNRLALASGSAVYDREGLKVEFDPDGLFRMVIDLIGQCAQTHGDVADHDAIIALTGQAESLVLLDGQGSPTRPGLSWLDDRAWAEAIEIGDHFGAATAFAVTGQPHPSPTWPAAKLRWLARHEPQVIDNTASVLMVKDDLTRRFTGVAVGEITTRGFTYFYDVPRGEYWGDMLEFVSVPEVSLPEIVPAGADLGPLMPEIVDQLPAALSYRMNSGGLDHFCAMVGTGSYSPDIVSESAGTVLSLSLLASEWSFDAERKVSFHAGLRSGDTVLFSGVDSGGVALEWYRREGLDSMSYEELEHQLDSRASRTAPIFLPYLTGVNPPDFFPLARGAFLGLELGHDRVDMAFAVEEGIAHLLRRNVDYLTPTPVKQIVSSGGGAASPFWNQLKADVCGVDVLVPAEHEATCRGAAVLALVAAGELGDLDEAKEIAQPSTVQYTPHRTAEREARYRSFDDYLQRLYGEPIKIGESR